MVPRPAITPMPPIAEGVGLPWETVVDDPVAALRGARAAHGDTFVVDSGPDRYLFTFSPVGVASFYALPEETASKGLADWRMLRRKVPDELFVGRRTFPHELFGRNDVTTYLQHLRTALDDTVRELGSAGTTDLFALTRRLAHRMGLASWGGPGTTDVDRFDILVSDLDALDVADAFVHPDAMAAVAASDKAAERAALAGLTENLAHGLDHLPDQTDAHPLFARVAARWDDEPPSVRRVGIAYDITLVHLASLSNLVAALGWLLVDLLEHPDELLRVRAGDRTRVEQCALESTRMAQRSIMSRHTLTVATLDVGAATHTVAPGITIATLLPLTNTTATPDLAHWDPDRWHRRRLVDAATLPAPELVTTFGHGHHTCPAQPFSLAAMTETALTLVDTYDLAPGWSAHPLPVPAQIGGIARAATPCPLAYRRRT